jgi:hypothetical protein
MEDTAHFPLTLTDKVFLLSGRLLSPSAQCNENRQAMHTFTSRFLFCRKQKILPVSS